MTKFKIKPLYDNQKVSFYKKDIRKRLRLFYLYNGGYYRIFTKHFSKHLLKKVICKKI